MNGADWFELQAEHDFIMWQLGQIHAEVTAPDTRSGLDRAIDRATGREDKELAERTALASELMARCDEIRAQMREMSLSDTPKS